MKNGIKSVLVLTSICLITTLLVALTNHFTAPVIEKNKADAANQSLVQVLTGAKEFDKLEKPADAPESVQDIYMETSGLGFAVTVSVTSSYSKSPLLYTVGVSNEGVITGIVITNYGETKDFGKDTYPQTYVGMDSALNGAELVSGVTYSSAAFRQGIEDVFAVLIKMDLIQAGEKSEEQKIKELLDKLIPGALNDSGTGSFKDFTVPDWGAAGYEASNGTGYILVSKDGTVYTVNPFGKVKAYDTEGKDITDTAQNLTDAAGAVPNLSREKENADTKALKKLAGDTSAFTAAVIDTVSTVTNAFVIDNEGERLYGFVCRPIGYNNGVMTVYGVLDENGKIKEIKISEIILYSQYYDDYELDEEAYTEGLKGKDGSTLSEEDTLISGATISGNAVNKALKDMFGAYEAITKGGNGN